MDKVQLNEIVNKVTRKVHKLIGKSLRSIILYGSYARGDYDAESDIDIMVLADLEGDDLMRIEKQVFTIAWNIGTEYGILVAAYVNNYDTFNARIGISPFYRNVINDGVSVYAI